MQAVRTRRHATWSLASSAAGFALLAGCAGEQGAQPPPVEGALPSAELAGGTARFSDAQILAKVYAPAASAPAGFYVDPASALGQSFSLRHLRDGDRGGDGQYDLCTDDMTTAIEWSQDAAATWPVVTVGSTALYTEITHQRTDLPDWFALHRVFRCRFLDPTLAQPLESTGDVGVLGPAAPAPGPEVLRQLAEYLWQFSPLSNPGAAVLGTAPVTARANGWRYTLWLARRVPADGACDRIEQLDWHYDLTTDGTLTRTLQVVRSFAARLEGATATVCPGS